MKQIKDIEPKQTDFSEVMELLAFSSLSLLEICDKCTPHLTISQFIKQFKSIHSQTPAQMRRELSHTKRR